MQRLPFKIFEVFASICLRYFFLFWIFAVMDCVGVYFDLDLRFCSDVIFLVSRRMGTSNVSMKMTCLHVSFVGVPLDADIYFAHVYRTRGGTLLAILPIAMPEEKGSSMPTEGGIYAAESVDGYNFGPPVMLLRVPVHMRRTFSVPVHYPSVVLVNGTPFQLPLQVNCRSRMPVDVPGCERFVWREFEWPAALRVPTDAELAAAQKTRERLRARAAVARSVGVTASADAPRTGTTANLDEPRRVGSVSSSSVSCSSQLESAAACDDVSSLVEVQVSQPSGPVGSESGSAVSDVRDVAEAQEEKKRRVKVEPKAQEEMDEDVQRQASDMEDTTRMVYEDWERRRTFEVTVTLVQFDEFKVANHGDYEVDFNVEDLTAWYEYRAKESRLPGKSFFHRGALSRTAREGSVYVRTFQTL